MGPQNNKRRVSQVRADLDATAQVATPLVAVILVAGSSELTRLLGSVLTAPPITQHVQLEVRAGVVTARRRIARA